jgi:hypothetical protein
MIFPARMGSSSRYGLGPGSSASSIRLAPEGASRHRGYELMEDAWPQVARDPTATRSNRDWAKKLEVKPKYVVSTTRRDFPWSNTHHVEGDLTRAVKAAKRDGYLSPSHHPLRQRRCANIDSMRKPRVPSLAKAAMERCPFRALPNCAKAPAASPASLDALSTGRRQVRIGRSSSSKSVPASPLRAMTSPSRASSPSGSRSRPVMRFEPLTSDLVICPPGPPVRMPGSLPKSPAVCSMRRRRT